MKKEKKDDEEEVGKKKKENKQEEEDNDADEGESKMNERSRRHGRNNFVNFLV